MPHAGDDVQAYWETFAHGADIGVRGVAQSKADAFAQAASALTAVVAPPQSVTPLTPIPIHCAAPDDELLLADWLNALIFEMATRQMLFSRFDLSIDANGLTATVWGEGVDRVRHQPAVEIKGATYTELAVRHHKDGSWLAQCVLDV
ncbi:Protein archease [Pandoraea terrae]|uniref:Protein archease n=1 Tax=Pandoraea terrae TaxID=1537710 RepID=A0A5E4XJP7_9BURK|nr:archease [Pandoraea terrae]VVE36689.1 Protein archease [Pandoraea terrae]